MAEQGLALGRIQSEVAAVTIFICLRFYSEPPWYLGQSGLTSVDLSRITRLKKQPNPSETLLCKGTVIPSP